MASIDALSAVDTKPDFSLNDNDFISLKAVKEVATLEDQRWRELLHAVHLFVADHLDECTSVPRTLKKGPYSRLLELFLSNGGSQLWTSDREGYQAGSHFVWPHDQEKIRFLAFVLIKLEAAKQCAKKRKESGADDKDNASSASSPPPPQAKKAKIMEPPKKGATVKVGSPERTGLFAGKTTTNGFKDTPKYQDSDDDMEDSIVVEEKADIQRGKKTTAGDPFIDLRNSQWHNLDRSSPSPAPRADRKPATKSSVKEASGLKFDVSEAPHAQGEKRGRKAADNPARADEGVKAAPSNKGANGKGNAKQAGAKTQDAAKNVKQKTMVDPQGKVFQDHFEVAAPEQQEKGKINVSGITVNAPDEQYHDRIDRRSPDFLTETIHVFTPDADGLQATVETDHVRIQPDLVDNAAIAVKARHKHTSSFPADVAGLPVAKGLKATIEHSKPNALIAGRARSVGFHSKHAGIEIAYDKPGSVDAEEGSSENGLGVTGENEDSEDIANEDRKLSGSTGTLTPGVYLPHASPIGENSSTAGTVAATASLVAPARQSHVFFVTVSQPEDPGTDAESLCLTFPPATTNWASFYCSLAMQLPVAGRVAFAMAKTCKIRVPGQGQRKSRVFSFEIELAVTDMVWANVMRMVAGLGGDSEPVEVEFFP